MTAQTNGIAERKFLHDLANPLGTAMFIVDSLVEDMAAGAVATDTLEQLKQAHAALGRMKVLLETRRNILIKEGVSSSRE